MGQAAAGSSAEHIRVPGDPGASTSHLIFFCDQCGMRVSPVDLATRKARLLDETRATCINCSHKRSSAAAALRPTDGSTRRSTKHIPVMSPSDRRSGQHDLSHAADGEPVVHHEHVSGVHHTQQGSRKRWLPVGLGAAVLVVVLIGVLMAGRSKTVETAGAGRTVEKAAALLPATPPTTPVPVVSVTESATKAGTSATVPNVPKTSPPADDYDPRAMVAASLLAQAKAQKGSSADELLEYKASLEKIRDGYAKTPAAIEAENLLGELRSMPAVQDLLDTIPEAKEYRLVYDLNLSRIGTSISYDRDERANITQPFDRIAYLVELKPKSGAKQWVFVSMDAFTDDLGKIGIPTIASGASFQQNVANLNVASNADGVTTGTGLTCGNIEFWPNNYGNRNALAVPNAVDNKYDFGDEKAQPLDGYGSMQVHNYEARQTIFAINHWRQGGNGADLGIGNRSKDNPDWTFSNSASNYSSKRLRVFVRLK